MLLRETYLSIERYSTIEALPYIAYRKTSIKRRVPNKRRGFLEIQSCQSTGHTL